MRKAFVILFIGSRLSMTADFVNVFCFHFLHTAYRSFQEIYFGDTNPLSGPLSFWAILEYASSIWLPCWWLSFQSDRITSAPAAIAVAFNIMMLSEIVKYPRGLMVLPLLPPWCPCINYLCALPKSIRSHISIAYLFCAYFLYWSFNAFSFRSGSENIQASLVLSLVTRGADRRSFDTSQNY